MIAISTSRRPSDEFRRIAKTFAWLIPNSIKVGRGHANLQQLSAKCWGQGARRLLVLHERNRKPHQLQLFDLEPQFRESFGLIMVRHFESRYDLFKGRHGKLIPKSMHLFLPPYLNEVIKERIHRFFEPVPRPEIDWGEQSLPSLTEKIKKIPKNVVSLEVIPLTQTLYRITLWQVSYRYPLLRMVLECKETS